MVRCPSIVIASLLGIGLLLGQSDRPALAQFADVQEGAAAPEDATDQSSGVPLLSTDELRALVAPVALYPDELLAIVLPAATNPLDTPRPFAAVVSNSSSVATAFSAAMVLRTS